MSDPQPYHIDHHAVATGFPGRTRDAYEIVGPDGEAVEFAVGDYGRYGLELLCRRLNKAYALGMIAGDGKPAASGDSTNDRVRAKEERKAEREASRP